MQQTFAYVKELYAIMEAIKKWHQYLLGRKFIIRIDPKSLRSLSDQVIQTPYQQKYLAKLLGYQFTIVYKPRKDNSVADALLRQPELLPAHFLALSRVSFDLFELLRHENKTSPFYQNLHSALAANDSQFVDYDVREGLLLHKGRLLLDPTLSLISLVFKECHSTPIGGHGSI